MQTSRWPISKLPIAHLEPFPYHKGELYVELLDRLAKYVTQQLHPNLRETVEHVVEEMEHIIADTHAKYVDGIQDFQRIHDAFMEDVNSALMALNDNAVADLAEDPGSALGRTLREIFSLQGETGGVVDIADYAGAPQIDHDVSQKIQEANDYADEHGLLLFGAGHYRIDDTVNITADCDLSAMTLDAHINNRPAIISGRGNLVLWRKKQSLPRIINKIYDGGGTWSTVQGSIGVQAVNNNGCEITVPFVQNFWVGLEVLGRGGGNAYNTYNLGSLWHNKRNLVMRSQHVNNVGYSTQNLFLGGRFLHSTQHTGERGAGTKHIHYEGRGGDTEGEVNNCTFIGASLEGAATEYAIDFERANTNQHINNRFEFGGWVIFRGRSRSNKLVGGYGLNHDRVEVENSSIGFYNEWHTAGVSYSTQRGETIYSSNPAHEYPVYVNSPAGRSIYLGVGSTAPSRLRALSSNVWTLEAGLHPSEDYSRQVDLGSGARRWRNVVAESIQLDDALEIQNGTGEHPKPPLSGRIKLYAYGSGGGMQLRIMFPDGTHHRLVAQNDLPGE